MARHNAVKQAHLDRLVGLVQSAFQRLEDAGSQGVQLGVDLNQADAVAHVPKAGVGRLLDRLCGPLVVRQAEHALGLGDRAELPAGRQAGVEVVRRAGARLDVSCAFELDKSLGTNCANTLRSAKPPRRG